MVMRRGSVRYWIILVCLLFSLLQTSRSQSIAFAQNQSLLSVGIQQDQAPAFEILYSYPASGISAITLVNFGVEYDPDYGFRLPSARDNRPLNFREFNSKINQVIYVSATPTVYELKKSNQIVEQLIRPTGLLDPAITVKPATGQVPDLIKEIEATTAKGQRVLVTTLTKRMAEELADYLQEKKIKVHYLHSEIDAIDRTAIIRDLRLAEFDVR